MLFGQVGGSRRKEQLRMSQNAQQTLDMYVAWHQRVENDLVTRCENLHQMYQNEQAENNRLREENAKLRAPLKPDVKEQGGGIPPIERCPSNEHVVHADQPQKWLC